MLQGAIPRKRLVALLTVEAVLGGMALVNFILIYKWAHEMGGVCWICPWYYPWNFSNAPSLLLIAAICLWCARWRFTKWPGQISALCFSAPLVYFGFQTLGVTLKTLPQIESLEMWRMVGPPYSLLFQYFLGLIISSRALYLLIRGSQHQIAHKPIRA